MVTCAPSPFAVPSTVSFRRGTRVRNSSISDARGLHCGHVRFGRVIGELDARGLLVNVDRRQELPELCQSCARASSAIEGAATSSCARREKVTGFGVFTGVEGLPALRRQVARRRARLGVLLGMRRRHGQEQRARQQRAEAAGSLRPSRSL